MSVIDENMLAFGSCIVGFGILVTALLALLFRHPNAPRWTRPEIVVMLVCVPVTATTGVGLGYTAYGLSQLANGTGRSERTPGAPGGADRPRHAWRVLRIRQRLRDYADATGGIVPRGYLPAEPTLASDEEPPPRPQPRMRSNHRAA